MPFKSDKQRRFMYSQHPEIAERWSKEDKRSKLIAELAKKRNKHKKKKK